MINKIIISISAVLFACPVYSQWESDKWLNNPVSDEIFSSYVDFMKYDKSLDFDLKIIESKKEDGIKTDHISFLSTPNQKVTAYFTTSMVGKINHNPTIIMLHGGGKKGKDGITKISKMYAREKINILSIDMQYFGERKTDLIVDFTEKEKHEKLYNQESQYLAFVIQTVKDVGRSFDLLVNKFDINKEKDYSFVEGMVKDIEQNNWKATPSDLKMCNRLYNIYKTPGTGYVRGRNEDDSLGIDEA